MLFEVQNVNRHSAEALAEKFVKHGNRQFESELNDAYRAVRDMWYRPADQPTGVQILEALGTSAQSVMQTAWLRVEMLINIATLMGKPELIDLPRLIPPYETTYKADGSLDTATLRTPSE